MTATGTENTWLGNVWLTWVTGHVARMLEHSETGEARGAWTGQSRRGHGLTPGACSNPPSSPLSPKTAALSMSGSSSIIVALNAIWLRRLHLPANHTSRPPAATHHGGY